ncbi:MAG: hypothetical protein LBL77_01380 [Endomicrobium sp.]|nr:hypothetical protein [Endomicrobium sp.]
MKLHLIKEVFERSVTTFLSKIFEKVGKMCQKGFGILYKYCVYKELVILK